MFRLVEPPGLVAQPGGGSSPGPGGTVVSGGEGGGEGGGGGGGTVVPGGGMEVVMEVEMSSTCPDIPQVPQGIVEGSHQMGGL